MNRIWSLLTGVAAASLMVTAAGAADLIIDGPDPIYNSPLFNFEGFYVGGTIGVGTYLGGTGTVGVVAGANFAVTDSFVLGGEFQGDWQWAGGYSALFLAKAGFMLTDDALIYGSGGGGLINGVTSYGLGAGIEMALADQLSGRLEAMTTGSWGAAPDNGKIALGLIWHMN
jgi:hypothetical protein